MSEKIKKLIALQPQLSEDYVLTLGASVFYFSSAEWIAVGCCDLMQPGYKREASIDDNSITALLREMLQKSSFLLQRNFLSPRKRKFT